MQDESWLKTLRQQDLNDLQRELSGQDGARVQRFLQDDDPRTKDGQQKRQAKRFRDLLHRLMLDPEYRALRQQLGSDLAKAESDADVFIENLQQRITDLQNVIDEMEASAARGPGGVPVFRTADGRVVTADGQTLPSEIADGIQWPEGAPKAEAYFAAKQAKLNLALLLHQWELYRLDVLGSIRDRYEDSDNPMTKDQMRKAMKVIEAARPPEASVGTQVDQEATLSKSLTRFPSFN